MIDALRRGAVPESGLDLLATDLGRSRRPSKPNWTQRASGGSVLKAVRGEYGSGKTLFARWLGERAKRCNFAVALRCTPQSAYDVEVGPAAWSARAARTVAIIASGPRKTSAGSEAQDPPHARTGTRGGHACPG
ncbi:MAG TPA: BREX system ATP-binding domain-containing protein [Streptomyces sp.]